MTNTLAILKAHPLVAILRGVRPMEVLDVAQVLIACGFRVIEVPLNSPQPLESMSTLAASVGPGIVVGAGTVLDIGQVDACAKAGASLILSPNMHTGVVRHTVARGLVSLPGVATASEGFAALQAGAHALKVFPADVLGVATLKAWRAVFPQDVAFFGVGGIGVDNLQSFRKAGACGAGLGSSLYVPGVALYELARRARGLVAAWGAQ